MADLKISALPAATTPLAGTEVLPIVQGGITEQVSVANLTAGRAVSASSLTTTGTVNGGGAVKSTGANLANEASAIKISQESTTLSRVSAYGPDASTQGTLQIRVVSSNGTASTVPALFSSTGVVITGTITSSDNFVVGTSGKGIDFSATPGTGTSELLADYEEGDWTPVYATSGSGFTTMTMDVISATYTKVGRQVTVRAFIRTDNVNTTGATGSLRISGLPFTSAANGYSAVAIGFATDWAGNTPLTAYVNDSATTINLMYRATVTGATAACVPADMTTGANADKNALIFSATYFA